MSKQKWGRERWEDQGAHPAGVGSGETPRPRGESAEVGSIPLTLRERGRHRHTHIALDFRLGLLLQNGPVTRSCSG